MKAANPPSSETRYITTGKGKEVRVVQVPLPPPPPPPLVAQPPRPWPLDRGPVEMVSWVDTALWHFLAIRATGSVPAVGGPSVPVAAPCTAEGFVQALQIAEAYWPQARSFDLVASDLQYLQKHETQGLRPGMNRLRDAVVVTTFAVVDRGVIKTPADVQA